MTFRQPTGWSEINEIWKMLLLTKIFVRFRVETEFIYLNSLFHSRCQLNPKIIRIPYLEDFPWNKFLHASDWLWCHSTPLPWYITHNSTLSPSSSLLTQLHLQLTQTLCSFTIRQTVLINVCCKQNSAIEKGFCRQQFASWIFRSW